MPYVLLYVWLKTKAIGFTLTICQLDLQCIHSSLATCPSDHRNSTITYITRPRATQVKILSWCEFQLVLLALVSTAGSIPKDPLFLSLKLTISESTLSTGTRKPMCSSLKALPVLDTQLTNLLSRKI